MFYDTFSFNSTSLTSLTSKNNLPLNVLSLCSRIKTCIQERADQ